MSIAISDVESLDVLANDLLSVAVAALGDTAGGTPDFIFNSVGPPAFDCCPMVAIHIPLLDTEPLTPSGPALAVDRQSAFGRLNIASFVVTATRCAPTIRAGETPSVAEMDAATSLVRQDSWALWNAIHHAIQNGDFKDTCSAARVVRATPVSEQGGCAGVQVFVRAELHGIPNPGPST